MEIRNTKYEIRVLLSWFLVLGSWFCSAQVDSIYRVSLILPFQTESTAEKLDAYLSAHDVFTSRKIHLNDDAVTALDFYEGILDALQQRKDSLKIELSVYDNWNSDSVTQELLKNAALKKSDIIIGSVSSSSAKLVADYCKQKKIVNLQPFTPSKSLTTENPYHVKLAPTIDTHVDAMFHSICDSFSGANIIILTPDLEKSTSVALRFDSLFRKYNSTATNEFSVALLNNKDMMLKGKKTTVRDQLRKDSTNILIITSFDESFINGNLRVLYENLKTDSIIVYGMPTWLNGDVLRLDYLNDFHSRITDAFNPDSPHVETFVFNHYFPEKFGNEPSRFSYLGFDVMNFVLQNFQEYGKDFLLNMDGQHYSGAVYQFDIGKSMKDKTTINYYENKKVTVFAVENYLLRKVW